MTPPTTTPKPRPYVRPYSDCPRLPADTVAARSPVDPRLLVQGAWLEVEIGPGRGGFMFERAAAAPEAGIIGLEVRRKWATLVDNRLNKQGVGARARVFAEDAKAALARFTPDGVFQRAFLHFPDPWWKKRHTKRLVMGDSFVGEIARLLVSGGELYIQTDVEERAAQYESIVRQEPRFVPMGDAEGSAWMSDNPYDARSPRERRAIEDGLPVHRMRFRRM